MEITEQMLQNWKNDIVRETANQVVPVLKQYIDDKHRDTIDIVKQEIKASEHKTSQAIEASEKRVINSVNEMIDGGIVPQFEEVDQRLTKLELAVKNA